MIKRHNKMQYQTEQEAFWAGKFGDDYIDRNQGERLIASKLALFCKALSRTSSPIESILELGANIGLNLKALKKLFPGSHLAAVEINQKAVKTLNSIEGVTTYNQSILEFQANNKYDLCFTSGVLIHINPLRLPDAYKALYKSSKKYILISEYYNPTPTAIDYRGHENKLFKRDFAGEMLDMYDDLELVDYGFIYRRDNNFPSDDGNWFLMRKKTNV